MKPHCARFRFHGRLNDFLPLRQKQQFVEYCFQECPGIKDPIETLGIPHPEVGSLQVNDQTTGLDYLLRPGDEVEVYSRTWTRGASAADPRFIVDVNLGKLARWLRLLGFDSCWRNDLRDSEVVDISVKEQRVILTRDRRLLFHRQIQYGYWVREVNPDLQVPEVLSLLDLWWDIRPFRRCAICNGLIQVVAKERILDKLEPLTRKYYDDFYQCADCGQIYWKGSHYDKLLKKIEIFKDHA